MKKHYVFSGLLTAVLLGALFLPFPSAQAAREWHIYLGQLHNHSGYLDDIHTEGYGPEEAYAAAKAEGMDFFALTDYSHSFDHAADGSLSADGTVISADWKRGKDAASAATDDAFTAIYGYEMAWQRDLRLGHIVTLATPGWQCRGQEAFQKLDDYYAALTQVDPSIGMFCHPGNHYGDFLSFEGRQGDYDAHMALVEVIGEDGQTFFDGYQTALDQGWHVAPCANGGTHDGSWGESPVRTGILAEDLSESSLYSAIRQRRVFATLDPHLTVQFSLGGHIMGSRVTGIDHYTADFLLSDPDVTVEIVTAHGQVVASGDGWDSSLAVPPGYPYYYLRLLRSGEIAAVTAPVWIQSPKDFGCGELTASASLPIAGEELTLSFSLYNQETATFTLDSIRLTADDRLVWEDQALLPSGTRQDFTVPYTHQEPGITKFTLTLSGSIGAEPVNLQRELTLSYRPQILTAHIMVDGQHSDISYDRLHNLLSLAEKADMDVAIFHQEMPENMQILIVPALERDFAEGYPQLLARFVENGGQLILCGQAENNHRMNDLLEKIGASMRLHNDIAQDPVHNGGKPEDLYPDDFHTSQWNNLIDGTFYSQKSGCTLDPGAGTWLVKGKDTMSGSSPVLLAKESMGKGTLYLAGSFFLNDDHMPLPVNTWDIPTANQLLLESLLDIQRSQLDVSDIQSLRRAALGDVFRVQGYVTAGTSDNHNRFPEMIYLQDLSGGIAVTSFEIPDIEIGMKLDITGQRTMDGKNPALKLISCQIIPDDLYRFDPERLFHAASMNYERHGGELMKVEGKVSKVTSTADGLGICRFTILDPLDVPAEILIEEYIHSGAYGVNHLADTVKPGETIRAYGILHLEENGNPVLRVRNCDEVTVIPPLPTVPDPTEADPTKPEEADQDFQQNDLSNPKTGDTFFTFSHFWDTMWKKE